jgi:Ca2+-binding EF-hand superfamily protein
LFDEIDADRSGLLDRDEISALLQSLGSEMTDAQVNAAMSLMDQDG